MIKTDNDRFYMTAGETCYVVKQTAGGMSRLFFGKRVEAEDDLSALGMGVDGIEETPIITVYGKNKPRHVKLIFDGAEVLPEKPTVGAAALSGGKTLKIAWRDEGNGLKVFVLYTPYTRGGYTRSVIINNIGSAPVKLDCLSNIDACQFGKKAMSAENGCDYNDFIAVVSDGCTEVYGDAYGFLCVYGNGNIDVNDVDGRLLLSCSNNAITLNGGEEYATPEILYVYSDRGLGGMTRIFHDILRDNMPNVIHNARMPVVLFAPVPQKSHVRDSVRAATELGCDIFAVDAGEISRDALKTLSEECKAAGIKTGIRVSRRINRSSALFGEYCSADGKYFSVDLSDGAKMHAFACALSQLIGDCELEYITVDVPRKSDARAVHGIFCMLSEKFGELYIEQSSTDKASGYDKTLCYPPSIMRNTVEAAGDGSLKTRFDSATFGRLGYAFDPLSLDDDIKRAVRAQILSYQDDASLVMNGDLYRTRTTDGDLCMTAVSKDKSKAYAVCECSGNANVKVGIYGLDEHNIYHVREMDKSFSGAALCACGIPLPQSSEKTTFTLHIRQVADFE